MRRSIATGLAVALLLAAPMGVRAQHGGVSLDLGVQGPGAELQDLDGAGVELADYIEAGKPTVLEFWATWCEQCEALQPQMDEIQDRFGQRVNVVAVAVGVSQSPRRIRRHLDDHDPGYPYLYDFRGNAVRAYNAQVTAIVVMLDAEGKVAYTGVGPGQDLVGAVQRILGD